MNDAKKKIKILLVLMIPFFLLGSLYALFTNKLPLSSVLISISVVMFISTLAALLTLYLQRTPTQTISEKEDFVEDVVSHIAEHQVSILLELEKIKDGIENKGMKETVITEEQRQEFVNSIKTKIGKTASNSILNEIKEEVRKQEAEALKVDKQKEIQRSITKLFNNTFNRLNNAINDQYKRGNLNLIIGIFITIIGLAVLGYYVHQVKAEPNNPWVIAEVFLPRLSLVILIEVFAFFFLKLYKVSLIEIKFFQNELTNFEAKYIAFRIAYQRKDREMSCILMSLANAKRNISPEKELTRIGIEPEEMDKDSINNMLNSFLDIAKKVKKIND